MEAKYFWGPQKPKYVIMCYFFFYCDGFRFNGSNKLKFEGRSVKRVYQPVIKFYSMFVLKKKNTPILLIDN